MKIAFRRLGFLNTSAQEEGRIREKKMENDNLRIVLFPCTIISRTLA